MKIITALSIAGTILLNIAGSLCQSDVCGQAPLKNKIVGGENATEGSWPWQVSIQHANGHFCGGSLINKDWVLSAAHCFLEIGTSDIVMYFGRWSQSGSNPNETYRTASQIIMHPAYEGTTTHNNDIALVQLSSSVNFTDYIRPVCLAAAGSVFAGGTESWVTGWGTQQAGGSQAADILQQVMLPIVNNSACNNAYGGAITSNMICAGFLNGKSSCQGDSGGPVVSRNGSQWIQSGIVSFGAKQCDDPKYPSVFARVSQYQDWIKSYMGSNAPGFVEFNSSGFRSSLNLLLFSISLTFSIIPFIFSLYLSS